MEIEALLNTYFSLKNCTIFPLEGYASVNYKVLSTEGNFVLKIYANTPRVIREILAEDEVLLSLQKLSPYDIPNRISNQGR